MKSLSRTDFTAPLLLPLIPANYMRTTDSDRYKLLRNKGEREDLMARRYTSMRVTVSRLTLTALTSVTVPREDGLEPAPLLLLPFLPMLAGGRRSAAAAAATLGTRPARGTGTSMADSTDARPMLPLLLPVLDVGHRRSSLSFAAARELNGEAGVLCGPGMLPLSTLVVSLPGLSFGVRSFSLSTYMPARAIVQTREAQLESSRVCCEG